MEQEQSKFKILINNLTPSQRVAIILGIVIFICVIVLGILLIPTNNEDNEAINGSSSDGTSNTSNMDEGSDGEYSDEESNNEYSDDDFSYGDDYIDPESTPIAGGDYNDINTYLPHVVYDKDNYYDQNENGYYDDDDFVDIKYFVDINDDDNIEISLSECNDTTSENLARDYLETIPADLISGYSIVVTSVYQEDPCE